MYNNTGFTRYMTRRNIFILVMGIVVFSMVIYVMTHGFLSIKNGEKTKTSAYSSFDKNLTVRSSKKKGVFNILPSGNYSVQVPMSGGGIDTSFVNVPRFLQTSTINRNDSELSINVLSRGVPARIAQTPSGLVGWDESGVITPLNSESVSNSDTAATTSVFFPNFDQVFQVDQRYVGGVTKTSDFYLPTYYDFTASDSQAYTPIKTSDDMFIKHESTGFSLIEPNKKTFNLYVPGQSSVLSVKELSDPVAHYNKQPLYSISQKRTAVLTGGDIFNDNENEGKENDHVKLLLHIVDSKSSKILKKISLGSALIQDVIISPDGTNIYVKTNESVAIYDSRSLKIVYAAPYSVGDFLWIDDDRFAFNAGDRGLFTGSVKSGHATTIMPYSSLQPTEISYALGDEVYFTAYSQSNRGSQKPDAYKVSFGKTMSNTDRKSLASFPHQTDSYYVDYINSKIIVQLTRYIYSTGSFEDNEAKSAAETYIRSIFGDSLPEIKYLYITSDLRKQTGLGEE